MDQQPSSGSGPGARSDPSDAPTTRPLFRPSPYPSEPSDPGATPPPHEDSLLESPIDVFPTVKPSPAVTMVETPSAVGRFRGGMRAMASNWQVLIPLVLFAIAAVIVPTMTNIATTDDWGYTRSVEILYWDIKLTVFPVVAATAIGQVFWGGLFALIFGMTLGVMRLSTVVAVAIGAIALYALLRQLGVSRSRSAMGTSLYLFNPLTFVLSFTFMTDPHFTSWMLVALAFYAWGLKDTQTRPWAIVLGSLAAGFSFWIRQQGALIPFAVVLYLFVTRKLWFNRRSVTLALQTALIPALMLIGYYVWLKWFNDVTAVQQGFVDEMKRAGWSGAWHLVRYLTYFEYAYLGLILVPILISLVPIWRSTTAHDSGSFRSPLGYWLFLGSLGIVVTGLYFFTRKGRTMPYIPQFVGPGGLGSPDVPGSRMRLIEWPQTYEILTIVAVIGAIVASLMICRQLIPAISPERAVAGLVAMVGLWQVVGVLPPSFHYIRSSGSLDRYLLPLIPLAIALLLWSIRDVRLFQPVGWVMIACLAVVSTAGTRDYLVYMDSVWGMARFANEKGVPDTKLDAGAGWDGYHLYTDMVVEGITKSKAPNGSPWWLYFYAKNSDATYVVATNPAKYPKYEVIAKTQYDQWLEDDPVYIYLLKQRGAPWPPE
ncbi:MAG: ArnT family glycosyltransferase [Thermomicrobiales bacterium]